MLKEMPKYKCHKEVWALKIKSILKDGEGENRETDGSAIITPEEADYAPFKVDANYMQKHKPHVGGYHVVYEDGYESFSPASAFESGYTLLQNHLFYDANCYSCKTGDIVYYLAINDDKTVEIKNDLAENVYQSMFYQNGERDFKKHFGIYKNKEKAEEYLIEYCYNKTFGEVLIALKFGKRATRKGWNGQGMYCYYVKAQEFDAITEHAKKEFGEKVPYRAYLALKTAQNDIACWNPSTSDVLAEDWIILND